MLGRWLGVSQRVVSALCYFIVSDKGKVISRSTVQTINADKPRYPKIQESILDYDGSLEAALGSEEFGTSLDGYESLMNDD